MTAAWPASLPQYVQQNGFQESLPDQVKESEMDSGPPKTRRRFTTAYRPISAKIWCTDEQMEAFEEFYEDVLGNGALPFTWVSPRTQTEATYRFRRPPPTYNLFGAGNVEITMQLWEISRADAVIGEINFARGRESGLWYFMGID